MPRGDQTDDARDAQEEGRAAARLAAGMTDGPGWPLLPPPDLADAYQQLPQSWKTGAVLLANRLLAAAYRADVLEVVERVLRDVEEGAIRGMTIDDYLEEQTEGHQRVVDVNKALQCLQYSPAAQGVPLGAEPRAVGGWATRLATRCFRADVEAELERRGVEFE